jgi:hypothetical protein
LGYTVLGGSSYSFDFLSYDYCQSEVSENVYGQGIEAGPLSIFCTTYKIKATFYLQSLCNLAAQTGYQIYHNYVREYQGLENKTPAERCGIKIEGENKWLTLIQNAKMSSSP